MMSEATRSAEAIQGQVVMKLPGLFCDTGIDEPDLKWISQPFKILHEKGEYFMIFDDYKIKVGPYYDSKNSDTFLFIRLRNAGFDMTEDMQLVDKFFEYIAEVCKGL